MTEQKDVLAQDAGVNVMRKALERIAGQQLVDERLVEGGDYEYGYDQIIKVAREALAAALTPAASDTLAHLQVTHKQYGAEAALEDAAEEIGRLTALVEKLTNTIKRIDAINDNPARFNVEIDEVCRPFTSTVRGSDV